jgi:RimJ/RimL family protein N-acetyltransferase
MIDWQPARMPPFEPVEGRTVRLEPLDVDRHAVELFHASAGADATWEYLPYGPFAGRQDFDRWLGQHAADPDLMTFTLIDRGTGLAGGVMSLMSIVPQHGVIEIGHIWLSPALQRTTQATEAFYLLARQAFDELGYRRLEWKCNALNEGSRRAAVRYGFTFEGVFRQHRVFKGRNRDTAWYSITDLEWPRIEAAFEAWLSPANFDPAGRQRRSLADFRS